MKHEDERIAGSPQGRDLEALEALARYRYLTTSQIQERLYPSRRVANRRLAILAGHGLVRRFRRYAVPGQGSNEFIYYLSAAGAGEAARREGRESVPYPKPRDRSPAGMEHLLGIIQCWLALDVACSKAGLEVPEFWPEWQNRQGGSRFVPFVADETPDLFDPAQKISFRPDAAFILGRNGRQSLFFLEVDWQTEALSGKKPDTFSHKFQAYASYRHHGGFRRYGEGFTGFRVLSTWTSEPRMQHARAVAAGLGLKQLFLFAPFGRVCAGSVLGPIWLPPGEAETEPHGLI